MENLQFEEFTVENLAEAVSLWQSLDGVFLRPEYEDSPEQLARFIGHNPGFSFVAKTDGRVIGTIMCGHDGRRGHLYHLAVHPTYRHQGIARELLAKALTQLQQAGIRKCILAVLKENVTAQEFYRKIGWVEEEIVRFFSIGV